MGVSGGVSIGGNTPTFVGTVSPCYATELGGHSSKKCLQRWLGERDRKSACFTLEEIWSHSDLVIPNKRAALAAKGPHDKFGFAAEEAARARFDEELSKGGSRIIRRRRALSVHSFRDAYHHKQQCERAKHDCVLWD